MSISLSEFFDWMDEFSERVPLDRLTEQMARLDLTFDEVAEVARFDSQRYKRNPLRAGSAYQALVLCWRPGQESPIHDHTGSSCGVRVIKGVMTEMIYAQTGDEPATISPPSDLKAGGVCGSEDTDIHAVSNRQAPGQDLVTLHVYSPPLDLMKTYTLVEGRLVCDEVSAIPI